MLRVLLVDDQDASLDMGRSLLGSRDDFQIIGEAHSGEEALLVVPRLQPDLVVMDVQMPGINGFETARRLLQEVPDLKVVLTSGFEDPEYQSLAHAVGAVGFIAKTQMSVERVVELLEQGL
jgi:DNA-binding NarL/FixJ family response regulator